MLYICLTPVYGNWRGDIGNYVVLVFFLLALFVNLVVGACTAFMRTDSKLSKCFLIKFFVANILVTISQSYNTLVQMEEVRFLYF